MPFILNKRDVSLVRDALKYRGDKDFSGITHMGGKTKSHLRKHLLAVKMYSNDLKKSGNLSRHTRLKQVEKKLLSLSKIR